MFVTAVCFLFLLKQDLLTAHVLDFIFLRLNKIYKFYNLGSFRQISNIDGASLTLEI